MTPITRNSLILVVALLLGATVPGQQKVQGFSWPDGKRGAISLSFDDARASQVDVGLPLLNRQDAKVTFFVVPSAVERRLEGWKKIVAAGHEIGNHSLNHPCSGNFDWSQRKALEDYTLDKMRLEIAEANLRIKRMLGANAETFAYPCGQTFVGRGVHTKSYVPLVTRMFIAGRGWLDEAANDPRVCDLAQVMCASMDGLDFEQVLPLLEVARDRGQWLVLGGHEIGEGGRQTTRVTMLEKLLEQVRQPASGLWVAPIGTVAKHIAKQRGR